MGRPHRVTGPAGKAQPTVTTEITIQVEQSALNTSIQPLTGGQARKIQQAQAQLQTGNAAGALDIARSVAAEAPDAPDAFQFLAVCQAETGDLQGAEQSFRRALQLAPDHPAILANLGTLLRRTGRPQEAVSVFERVTEQLPDQAKGWIELGRSALAARQGERAVQALETAVKLDSASVAGWHALGRARRATDDMDGAEAAFRHTTELAPDNPAAWANLGVVLRLLGRPQESLACYDRAEQAGYSGPDLADARTGALLDTGRSREALDHARRVAEEHPEFPDAQDTLAHLLWEYGPAFGEEADPLEHYRRSVGQRPEDRRLRLAFVRFLLQARRADEAIREIERLREQADHPMLKTLQANGHEILGQSEQAGRLYREAEPDLGDRDAGFLNSYTRHLLRAGQWREAADRAHRATRISPLDQESWAYLATAWRLLGDEREFWLCDYDRLITLIEVPPPDGYASLEEYLVSLRKTLESMHQAGREPVQQSLRNGSQTPGRLFGRPDPVIEAAQVGLTRSVEDWLGKLPDDREHPFHMRNTRRIRYSGSWSVKLWSSGSHVNHIHSQGWISSAYYVFLPPAVRDDDENHAGYIQFGQPPVELGLDLEPRRVIRPRPGWLALFPSYLWHGTVPFEDDQPRITMAFDMVPA